MGIKFTAEIRTEWINPDHDYIAKFAAGSIQRVEIGEKIEPLFLATVLDHSLDRLHSLEIGTGRDKKRLHHVGYVIFGTQQHDASLRGETFATRPKSTSRYDRRRAIENLRLALAADTGQG